MELHYVRNLSIALHIASRIHYRACNGRACTASPSGPSCFIYTTSGVPSLIDRGLPAVIQSAFAKWSNTLHTDVWSPGASQSGHCTLLVSLGTLPGSSLAGHGNAHYRGAGQRLDSLFDEVAFALRPQLGDLAGNFIYFSMRQLVYFWRALF